MKKSADITMRGRPERQEMLQLEAAMSASYSHKPPPCSYSTNIFGRNLFNFGQKHFMVLAKSWEGFSFKLCFACLILLKCSFLSQQVLTLKLLFLNHNLRELDFVCLCVSDKLAKLGDAIAISNHSLTHWLTGVCAGRFYRIEKSWSPHLPCIQGVFRCASISRLYPCQ